MNDWEETLFALEEKGFMNLIKNYLLTLNTPYNKQSMIERLSAWLGKEDNRAALFSRITEEEKDILSLLYYLDQVPGDKLPLEWDEQIRENLCERLLIYLANDRYLITPPLREQLLQEGHISFLRFLDLREPAKPHRLLFAPDDRLIMGLLSFFSEEKPFFLNDGTPRRKIIEDLQEILPYPEHREDSFFCEMTELLLRADLLERKEKNLILCSSEKLESFEALTQESRIHHLALLNAPASSRGKLRYLLGKLPDLIPADRVISDRGWLRLLYLAEPRPSRQEIHHWQELPSRLALLGLCTHEEGETGFPPAAERTTEGGHPVLIQPNGDIDLPPETPFSATLVLSTSLEKGGTYYRFQLTRDSFESGLRRGRTGARLKGDLEKLTGHSLPPNFLTNLDEWEKQLNSLRRVRGILLRVSGYPRRIMDQSPGLAEHILERPGDEWYLMNEDTQNQWKSLLRDLGLNPFEEIGASQESPSFIPEEEEPLSLPRTLEAAVSPGEAETSMDKEQLQEALRELNLPEEQYREFYHRIERGVLLFPEQMEPAVLRQEVCKAGGLDFNGKLRIVSSSLESRYPLLEMKLPGKGGIRTVQAVPLELHNSREESLLLFRNEEGEEEQIAVRKILEVIRFHGSLLS